MSLAFSEEQDELRRTVRAFLEEKSPELEVRRLMETSRGYDDAVWHQMSEQLGLPGLAIPEELGGSGFTFVELMIVLEEMGRRLVCAPYFSGVVLAANALLLAGDDEAARRWLPGIATGDTLATVALTEEAGRWDDAGVTATATANGDGWAITGVKSFVLDGAIADVLVVPARTAAGVTLFAVTADAAGLTRTPLETLDATRKQARVALDATPATLVGTEGRGWPVVERVLDLAAAGLAAEQVGGAQRCLDMAVGYAGDRVQFGRPIGSFQAVKHRCADMLMTVELARSAAYHAGVCAAENADELPEAAAVAKVACSDGYLDVAADNIQVHGGIGFTYEHPAHLYYRRAKSSQLLFGDPTRWRELLAQRIEMA